MNLDSFVDSSAVKTAVSAGNYAYIHIPTDSLRNFFDNAFPTFAKNATADIAKGFSHRWTAGHDLLIDIPNTFAKKGWTEAAKQTGHILLTDFPTKAGIPIPGFSASGLGKFLTETCKIPKGYLCLNFMDTAVGVFAMTEGTFDLFNVISGQLRMSPSLFFDTFVEGAADIALGVQLENPLLLFAGIEQISAGIYSSFYTITHPLWFVSPIDFFTGCLSGGILTFAVSKFILKKDTETSAIDATKSCVLGGLFTISFGFGIGGIVALVGCGFGKIMAEKQNRESKLYFRISETQFQILQKNKILFFPEGNVEYNFLTEPNDLREISFQKIFETSEKDLPKLFENDVSFKELFLSYCTGHK